MQTIKSRSAAILGAILATFASVAVAAPAHAEATEARVSYHDLDLTTPAARKVLARRIARAADQVCGPSDPLIRVSVETCRSQSIARAQASVEARQAARQIAVR